MKVENLLWIVLTLLALSYPALVVSDCRKSAECRKLQCEAGLAPFVTLNRTCVCGKEVTP